MSRGSAPSCRLAALARSPRPARAQRVRQGSARRRRGSPGGGGGRREPEAPRGGKLRHCFPPGECWAAPPGTTVGGVLNRASGTRVRVQRARLARAGTCAGRGVARGCSRWVCPTRSTGTRQRGFGYSQECPDLKSKGPRGFPRACQHRTSKFSSLSCVLSHGVCTVRRVPLEWGRVHI